MSDDIRIKSINNTFPIYYSVRGKRYFDRVLFAGILERSLLKHFYSRFIISHPGDYHSITGARSEHNKIVSAFFTIIHINNDLC
jgi:hypothetical protein